MALRYEDDRATLTLPINCSASGDNVVISPEPANGFKIWKLWLVAASAVTVTYKSGSNTLSGPVGLVSGGSQTMPYDGIANLSIQINSAFIINLSAPVQVSGMVYYTRG